MTLEAWVNTPTPAGWRCVILKERPGGLSYGLYGGDLTGRAAAFIRRGSDIDAAASSSLTPDTWVHVAATYDGTTLRTFVNGVQVASKATTGAIVTSTSPLRIGGDSSWGEYFTGTIDEVRVYNIARTAAQIQSDMATPISGTPPPPPTYPGDTQPPKRSRTHGTSSGRCDCVLVGAGLRHATPPTMSGV